MKFFEFRYKSKYAKFFNGLLSAISCFIYPPIITIVFILILKFFGISNRWPGWMITALLLVSIVFGIVFVVIYFTNDKGILLCDSYFVIERYSINDFHPIPNMKIFYKDIKYVYNSRETIGLHTMKARKALVSGGDLSYYVEIGLKGGKEIFFSIENQEDFVEELIHRIN